MFFSPRLICLLVTFFAISELAYAKKTTPGKPTVPVVVHEARKAAPPGWQQVERVQGGAPLMLKIGLAQSNLDKADTYIMGVSDPKSGNYGKHWSAKQIAETFAPSATTVKAVNDWLIGSGFNTSQLLGTPSMGWVRVNTTFAQAEALLDAKYHHYVHKRSGTKQVAATSYSLPRHLAGTHIDLVLPSVHFDAKPKTQARVQRYGEDKASGNDLPKL